MELTTTRDTGGALTTRTPGVTTGLGELGPLFAALIQRRLAAQAPQSKPIGAGIDPALSGRAAAPRGGQGYAPQLASAPISPRVSSQRGDEPGSTYSYRFGSANGGSWAGSAPQLPTFTGRYNPNSVVTG